MNASRTSLRRLASTGLQQIALAAILALLLLAWLQVPDANAFEVLLSILLALLLLGVFGAGESVIALRLTRRDVTVRQVMVGTVACIVAALVCYGLTLAIDKLSVNDSLRAGYLNSRFPASLRKAFSYQHLLYGFGLLWSALRWLVAGLLAASAFTVVTGDAFGRGLLSIVRSSRYWLALLLLCVAGAVLTGLLMNWTPGHGLRVEALSLLLRLLATVVLDAAAIAFLLQAMADALPATHSEGTDAPVLSQPRTAERP